MKTSNQSKLGYQVYGNQSYVVSIDDENELVSFNQSHYVDPYAKETIINGEVVKESIRVNAFSCRVGE